MLDTLERRIADMLNDPLTGLLIAADHVDRTALAAQLRHIATLTAQPAPERDAARFYEPLRHPRPRAAKTPLARLSGALCGACTQ